MFDYRFGTIVASCVLVCLVTSVASATKYFVEPEGPGGLGTSWETAFDHPADALGVAGQGDEIWVAGGTYTISSTLTMVNGVEMYGGFHVGDELFGDRNWRHNPTILDGAETAQHVVTVVNCTLTTTAIDGFLITGGRADGTSVPDNRGAGMFIQSSSVQVVNCKFTDNVADGSADFDGGGAAYVAEPSGTTKTTFRNVVFNDSMSSGGNSAAGVGGGAAFINAGAEAVFVNCLFVNNEATESTSDGGAILNHGTITVTNCTLFGNAANGVTSGQGGGIFQANPAGGPSASLTVANSIFWGNEDAGGDAETTEITWVAGSATITYTTIEDCDDSTGYCSAGGDHNNGADPLFDSSATNWPYITEPFSPAINIGNNDADIDSVAGGTQALPDRDIHDVLPTGSERILEDDVDLGAYEQISFTCTEGQMKGDMDNDCDVDLEDFGDFQTCFSGPCESAEYLAPSGACRCVMDWNDDRDVDLQDFGDFQLAYTGPLNCACGGCLMGGGPGPSEGESDPYALAAWCCEHLSAEQRSALAEVLYCDCPAQSDSDPYCVMVSLLACE